MRSNRGITVTSLIIYVIGLVVMIGIMSTFTNYFYKNVDEIVTKESAQDQYSKFLTYVTNDVNSKNLKFFKVGNEGTSRYAIFKFLDDTEHQYILNNNKIYFINTDQVDKKKVVLCKNVTKVTDEIEIFTYSEDNLTINLKINGSIFSNKLSIKL